MNGLDLFVSDEFEFEEERDCLPKRDWGFALFVANQLLDHHFFMGKRIRVGRRGGKGKAGGWVRRRNVLRKMLILQRT